MPETQINDLDYKPRRVLVLGVSGTGKSTLTARLIHTHPAPLVLVYDWQGGEFGRRLGGRLCASREELAEAIDGGTRLVCYDAEVGEQDPQGAGFEWFCEMAFEVSGVTPGRKLVVADDCHDLLDPWNMPPALGKLLGRGRRRLVDTCLIGEAANCLQTKARNQVSELYVFRCTDENSLKYPASVGLDIEKVKNLQDTHFIYRDMRTGDQKELDLWGQKSKPEIVSSH